MSTHISLIFFIFEFLRLASSMMFSDDTNIAFPVSTLPAHENRVNSDLKNLKHWLIFNKLSLNELGPNQRLNTLLNDDINIEIEAETIARVKEAKSLGLSLIDEQFHSSHGLSI